MRVRPAYDETLMLGDSSCDVACVCPRMCSEEACVDDHDDEKVAVPQFMEFHEQAKPVGRLHDCCTPATSLGVRYSVVTATT